MNESIGAKLKILRNGRKLTQDAVAAHIGCTRATLSNYEIGRRLPNITTLKKFADYYGVGLDYFGVVTQDEAFDLLSRAREVFENDDISKDIKNDIYKELLRIYLKIK